MENSERKAKLKYYFEKNDQSLIEVANVVGIAYSTLRNKLNDVDSFTVGEVRRIVKVYDVTDEDIMSIFVK